MAVTIYGKIYIYIVDLMLDKALLFYIDIASSISAETTFSYMK